MIPMPRCVGPPRWSPTGREAPGSATVCEPSTTGGACAAWRAAPWSWCCPTGGTAAIRRSSAPSWPGCSGSPTGSSGSTRSRRRRATRRWPRAWPRRCHTSTSSSRGTRSPRSRRWPWWWAGDRGRRWSREEHPMRDLLDELDRWRAEGVPVAVARVVDLDGSGPRSPGAAMAVNERGEVIGSVSGGCVEGAVVSEAVVAVFVESFAPPPQMLVFGAVDFTAALVRVAKVLGYRVTVCDAREVFATRSRFPQADDVVVDWPDRLLGRVGAGLTARDAVCVLTHDAKFDVPALIAALDTEVGYVGAMGSRRTHADRLERLREAGVGDEALARIRAPIGIDIGARTPEETAVSICAEIIAQRTGRHDARPLRSTDGPIHRPAGPASPAGPAGPTAPAAAG